MKKIIKEWLEKADADLCGAERLVLDDPPLNDLACFHCQQAAEKYLKALLINLGLPAPKIHDLEDLLEILLPRVPVLSKHRRGLATLSKFAVEYRYPGVKSNSRKTEAALRKAKVIRSAIRKELGLAP